MIHIKDPTEFRIKIQKVIASLMSTSIYSVNIEKGILNYTIRVCLDNYIVKNGKIRILFKSILTGLEPSIETFKIRRFVNALKRVNIPPCKLVI